MKPRPHTGRVIKDRIVRVLSVLAALGGIVLLFLIIKDVAVKGLAAIGVDFFTHDMTPAGIPGGGVRNAIYGTVMITLIATAIGVPTGLAAGVYLSEYGRGTRAGRLVRFMLNVLMGIPSILVGVFFFAFLIVSMGHGSGVVGALALAVIMIPIVAITTEEMLLLVPDSVREAALALGAPRWRVTLSILFRSARSGLITGILLAVARVSGETAPLIFTARFSQFWPDTLHRDTANLTMTIYNYAGQPFDDLVRTAWGASLLVMFAVLVLTVVTKTLVSGRRQ